MIQPAYKLLRRRKNGTLGPLFINASQVIPLDEWLEAEDHPTKGYAHRPGWHCTLKPVAPHIKLEPKNKPPRIWCRVLIEDATHFDRPQSQGGTWVLARRMKVLGVYDGPS